MEFLVQKRTVRGYALFQLRNRVRRCRRAFDVSTRCGADTVRKRRERQSTVRRRARLRAKGIRVESLARVASMSEEGGVVFAD